MKEEEEREKGKRCLKAGAGDDLILLPGPVLGVGLPAPVLGGAEVNHYVINAEAWEGSAAANGGRATPPATEWMGQ